MFETLLLFLVIAWSLFCFLLGRWSVRARAVRVLEEDDPADWWKKGGE